MPLSAGSPNQGNGAKPSLARQTLIAGRWARWAGGRPLLAAPAFTFRTTENPWVPNFFCCWPRFLYGIGQSECCNSKVLLVRSREGGFVSRNCLKCGKSYYIRQEDLPSLDCEICGTLLDAGRDEWKSYIYNCGKCKRSWKLADNLPHWSELFSYSGLAASGDTTLTG